MAQAKTDYTTVPLYSLISDWKLRRIFWKASREAGDEFAVPAVFPRQLDGGAAATPELEEALS